MSFLKILYETFYNFLNLCLLIHFYLLYFLRYLHINTTSVMILYWLVEENSTIV